MGSELRCQNFDFVKFREIIPRNPCYGTFFSQNFESELSKNSDPPAEPKLESEFWPNSDPSSGLATWSELHLEAVAPRFEEIYKGGKEGDSRP